MSLFVSNGLSGWRRRHGEPKNRRELFLCVLFDHMTSLISINFFYLLFWIPAILWAAVCLSGAVRSMRSGDASGTVAWINALFLGLVPCLTVTGPAKAGMTLLMKNWAREDMVPAVPMVLRGMRENWRQALVLSFAAALFPAALWFAGLSVMQSGSDVMELLFVLACVAVFILSLALPVVYYLIVSYRQPLRGHLRNALLLTFLKLPTAFLIRAATLFALLLYGLFAVLRPEMRYALLAIPVFYYFFLGASLTVLIDASYANLLRDRYLAPLETDGGMA